MISQIQINLKTLQNIELLREIDQFIKLQIDIIDLKNIGGYNFNNFNCLIQIWKNIF